MPLKNLRESYHDIPEATYGSSESEQRVGAAPLRGGDWGVVER